MTGAAGLLRCLLLAALPAAAQACVDGEPSHAGGSSTDPGVPASGRDSAGVRIVETSLEGLPVWRVGDASVAIGEAAGSAEQTLHRVRTPFRRADGGVVVANAGSSQIRFYGPGGDLLRAVGREGDGPGEFHDVGWVRPWRGDSLVVWDPGLARLTVLDADGATGRTLRLGSADPASGPTAGVGVARIGGGSSRPARAVDVLTGGRFLGALGQSTARPGDTTAVLRVPWYLGIYDADGRLGTSLGEVPGDEEFRWATDRSRSIEPRAFGRSTAVAGLGPGAPAGSVAVADNAGLGVRILDGDGATLLIARIPLAPRPLDDDLRDAHRRAELDRIQAMPPPFRGSARERLDVHPYPSTLPWHGDLIVGGRRVWLERYRSPTDRDTVPEWIGFDIDSGRGVARLRLPGGAHLADLEGDTAVLVTRDDLDVERILVVPIRH